MQQAQTTLDQAKASLAAATLTAPSAGTITAVAVKPGDSVATSGSTGAFTLFNPSGLYFDASVAETDLPSVKAGQTVLVTIDALPGQRFSGSVAGISLAPSVTQGVVTYDLTIALQDLPQSSGLAPGMSATGSIVVQSVANALILPARAIRRQGTQQVVDVWASGKTTPRVVTTGLSATNGVQIVDGLSEGELVELPQTTTTTTGTRAGGGLGGFGGGFGGGGGAGRTGTGGRTP